MSATLVFDRWPEVSIGTGDGVHVHGRVYHPASTALRGLAQVSIDTGAANVTFYPTPEALEDLAACLQELAIVVRDMREQAAA